MTTTFTHSLLSTVDGLQKIKTRAVFHNSGFKRGNVMLNLFQHLSSIKILKQVQNDARYYLSPLFLFPPNLLLLLALRDLPLILPSAPFLAPLPPLDWACGLRLTWFLASILSQLNG